MGQVTPVVKNLLILNVGIFLLQWAMPGIQEYLVLYDFRSPNFFPTQLFTHIFLHADLMHILFNCIGLYFLGPALEAYIGDKRFILLYVISGIGAGVLQNWSYYYDSPYYFVNSAALGASGAVAGIMAATAIKFPNVEVIIFPIPIPVKLKYMALIYAGYSLFSGIGNTSNIAHFAHLGGMIFGAILILLWNQQDRNQSNWH